MLNVVANGTVVAEDLIYIIHTPLTPTPVCYVGENQDIDPEIAKDPTRLATVTNRQQIIMAMLDAGVTFVSMYNNDGLSKRSEEGQARYKELLVKYPNLIDYPLPKGQELTPDEVGATAWVKSKQVDEPTFAFTIQASQANKEATRKWEFASGSPAEHKKIVEELVRRRALFYKVGAMEPESKQDLSSGLYKR